MAFFLPVCHFGKKTFRWNDLFPDLKCPNREISCEMMEGSLYLLVLPDLAKFMEITRDKLIFDEKFNLHWVAIFMPFRQIFIAEMAKY